MCQSSDWCRWIIVGQQLTLKLIIFAIGRDKSALCACLGEIVFHLRVSGKILFPQHIHDQVVI